MCYYISINKKKQDLKKRFKKEIDQKTLFDDSLYINAFTKPLIPIISTENTDLIQFYQWGLIPFWVKDQQKALQIQSGNFNSKCETIFEKPSFKYSIKNKRCLVIVTGFFEYFDFNNKKYPFYIKLKSNEIFCLAGIWDNWYDKKTLSIITTEANPLMAKIHNTKKRMPVILKSEDEEKWLYPNLSNEEINSFFIPYNENDMDAYTVINPLVKNNADFSLEKVVYNELIDKF